MKLLLSAVTIATVCSAQKVSKLASFDGFAPTTWGWQEQNDPVMGGASFGTFTVDTANKVGVFNGTCAIVPFLKAPGFCKTHTEQDASKGFPDISDHLDGSMQIRVRTSSPDYKGYKLEFGAKDVPKTSLFGGGSFKASFEVTGTDWQIVNVPFSEFSYDWSGYTGTCDFKDPDGTQHYCCSADHPEVCPTAEFLSTINEIGVWSEGVEGSFHMEIDYIGAVSAATPVCEATEYCCPDAKHCLYPTTISCVKDESACKGDQVCCPLTKLCVDVGAECTSPCADTNSFCCPEALHCLTPVAPGVLCKGASDCKSDETCCPVTNLCVTVGDACTPPVSSVPEFMTV